MTKGRKKGFTLIEIIHDFAIVALVATAIISTFVISMKAIQYARTKMTALVIANERMEEMRNMPYDDLGTVNGAPPGSIAGTVEVEKEGARFDMATRIDYVDDPYDGLASDEGETPPEGIDNAFYDYKRIEVVVFEVGRSNRLAELSSFVAGKVAETDVGRGALKVCVRENDQSLVAGAKVDIVNDVLGTQYLGKITPLNDCLYVYGLVPDNQRNYLVTASKDGYATAGKYTRVKEQRIFQITLYINPPGQMTIEVIDGNGAPLSSFPLQVSDFNVPYLANVTTGADGTVLAASLPAGNYRIYELSDEYYIEKTQLGDPYIDVDQPLAVNDGDDLRVRVGVLPGSGGESCDPADPTCGNSGNQCIDSYRKLELNAGAITAYPVPETAALAIDGNQNTVWGVFYSAANSWIIERSATVSKLVLSYFTYKTRVAFSSDLTTWEEAAFFNAASEATVEKVLDVPVSGRYWRVTLGDRHPVHDTGTAKWLGEFNLFESCE